jgi:signal transduction histidine kinase
MSADKGIAGWVFTHCEPLIVGDVSQDERFYQDVDHFLGYETQSLIAAPLMTPTEKLGVVQVLNKRSGEMFDEHDLDTLSALAAQAAVMFVNARLYQELEQEKNRIIALEDQVHKKLARDLHDGPAQTLAAMMMDIEFIQKLSGREPERVPEELAALREAAGKTLDQVRNAMFELRPLVLETEGLKAALEYYVDRQTSTEGINIHLDVRDLDERLPFRMESLCFAIIHEAVGNAKKHAEADNTWIVVERRSDDVIVAVRDDGKGFDVKATEESYSQRGSLGLLNIKERCEVLGARYAVESKPGQGTLVYLIAPIADGRGALIGAHADSQVAELSADGRRRKRKTGPLDWTNSEPKTPTPADMRRKGTGPLSWFGPDEVLHDPSF